MSPIGKTRQLNSLRPGAVLDGKYEILSRLNEIGPSEVYLVRHVHLDLRRIVKVLRERAGRDDALVDRFQREALTATQIQHPRLATLFDYSVLEDGTFYMVWEYLEGRDVASWIEEHGAMPIVPAIELGLQALQGLAAMHAVGIVHRDVSPDNLMLARSANGEIGLKIIDLGLALDLTDESGTELLAGGKFLYCSPEQAGVVPGASLDHRSDIYSFALVLYEMISGHRPFDVNGRAMSLERRFQHAPAPLRGRNPSVPIPPTLDRVVLRALSVDPGCRQDSAQELAAELEPILESLKVEQRQRDEALRLSGPRARVEDEADEAAEPLQVPEGDPESLIGIADRALREGRLEVVRSCLERLRSLENRPLGFAELEARYADSEQRNLRTRVQQTEELLEQHIRDRKQALAEMALDLLFEIAPEHPDRSMLEWRVSSMGSTAEDLGDGRELFERGRRLAIAGDIAAAQGMLSQLEEIPGALRFMRRLRREVEAREREQLVEYGAGKLKRRIEQMLSTGRVEAAEKELEQLAVTGVPKLVVDLLRQRIADSRKSSRREWQARMIELRFPRLLTEGDYVAARETAIQLGELFPESGRPAEMFAEIARYQDLAERDRSAEHGRQVVEQYLESGRLDEAEVALETLLRLAPEHPRRARLESELRNRRGARGPDSSSGLTK